MRPGPFSKIWDSRWTATTASSPPPRNQWTKQRKMAGRCRLFHLLSSSSRAGTRSRTKHRRRNSGRIPKRPRTAKPRPRRRRRSRPQPSSPTAAAMLPGLVRHHQREERALTPLAWMGNRPQQPEGGCSRSLDGCAGMVRVNAAAPARVRGGGGRLQQPGNRKYDGCSRMTGVNVVERALSRISFNSVSKQSIPFFVCLATPRARSESVSMYIRRSV